ncbi:MAG: enoyl-CoA hydratase/isomerase family protein [Desulfobacterales bacterium]
MAKKFLLTKIENHICTLTLSRPEKKNSLSLDLIKLLQLTLHEIAEDDGVRVVILRGAGDEAFCSGFDIGSLPTKSKEDADQRLKSLDQVESLLQVLIRFPCPVIAMLNGFAFGLGCELAMCCDIRIGAEHIRMGVPPARLGLVYPWTGLQRFIQRIGLQSTKEIFFTGRTYAGQRIKELGLVDYLVPGNELEEFTYRLAEEIAGNAPLALKGIKKVINLLTQSERLDQTRSKEAQAIFKASLLSEDMREGQAAFLEKRQPRFKGK